MQPASAAAVIAEFFRAAPGAATPGARLTASQLRMMALSTNLVTPLHQVLAGVRQTPSATLERLFRLHYALGEAYVARTPAQIHIRAAVLDFPWRVINDFAVDMRARDRLFPDRRLPWCAEAIARERRRGRVPQAVGDVHASVGFSRHYAGATRAAFLAVPWRSEYRAFDFQFLAGLDVEILCTARDLPEVDLLSRVLELDGVLRIRLRRIDGDFPAVTIHDGGRSWLLRL